MPDFLSFLHQKTSKSARLSGDPLNWCDLYTRQGFFPRLSVHFIGASYTRVRPIHGKIRYMSMGLLSGMAYYCQ